MCGMATWPLYLGSHSTFQLVGAGTTFSRLYMSTVALDVKPGHTYMPRAARSATGEVRIWMEDMGTDFDQECLGVLAAGTFSRC